MDSNRRTSGWSITATSERLSSCKTVLGGGGDGGCCGAADERCGGAGGC